MNQVRNLDLNTNEKTLTQSNNSDHKETDLNTETSNQNGTYAIASSTTLVYITSPPVSAPLKVTAEETNHLLSLSAKGSVSSAKRVKYNQTSLSTYNTVDKLAAAAAVVSSASDSLVEIPNFGQSLSSMMDHNKMVCYLFITLRDFFFN